MTAPTAAGASPDIGWKKWAVTATMMFCSWLSYMDRQVLAVLAPMILKDTGLTTQAYSEVVSCFSFAYMLGNPVWGAILDRIGLRGGMLIAVGIWSVASASHAWMGSFLGFAIARSVLGFGEGATFPGGLRSAMETLPRDRQARGVALAYSGGSLGAILAPILVIPVATRYGWQAAFLITGLLGLTWLVLWSQVSRPPFLTASAQSQRIVWPNLMERRFWALVVSYALGAGALGPILYLSPLYLNRVLGLTQGELSKVLWIPPLGWEVGYFAWGWIADRFAPDQARPVRLFVLLAVFAVPLAAVPHITSAAIVLLLFFWSMFIAAGYVVLSLRSAARAYPKEQTALVAGIGAGSWSALLAVMLPELGRWFDQKRYEPTFLLVSLLPILGTVLWLALTRPTPQSPKP